MHRNLWRTLLLTSIVLFVAVTLWSFEARVMGSPDTTLSVGPRVNVKAPGELFNVTITVADVANDNRLYAWEFNVTFNPVVLEATKYLLGPFPPEGGTWDLKATFNNSAGWVAGGDSLLSYSDLGLNGTGILAYLTFRVKAEGKSSLHFSYTALRGWNPSAGELTQIVHTSIDGLFQYPLLRDLAVTGVTSSTTSVSSGGSVSIDVTVTNKGNVSETFDVSLSYNSTQIDTKTVTDLAPDAVDTVNFVWDTKNVVLGSYVITATILAVSGETNTGDNSNSNLVVKVTAAPPIIPIELLIGVILAASVLGAGIFVGTRRRKGGVKTKISESPAAQELPPSPTTLPLRKSKRGLIIAIVLVAIVLGVIISTYVMADANVASAINSCTSTAGDYRITGMTILPPSVDMEMDLIIRNPSNMNLHLNRFQADIFIEYAGTVYTLGGIDVSDKSLPANGYVSVPASIHAGTNVVNFLTAHPSGYDVVVSGTLSVTGTWLFWTITKESTESVREHV